MYLRYESKKNDLMVFGSKQFTLRYYSIEYKENGVRVDTLRFIQRFSSWREALEKAYDLMDEFKEVQEDL